MTGNGRDSPGGPEKSTPHGDIFRIVFDKIQTGIVIIDPDDHTILNANPIARRLIGRETSDLVGKSCQEFICPAKSEACPVTDQHLDLDSTERALIHASGEKIPVLKTVAVASFEGKEVLIESFADMRDRKKSEERKEALVSYMTESVIRVKKPLELTRDTLEAIASDVRSGESDAEEIYLQIRIQAKNLVQIQKNLDDLVKAAVSERDEIPRMYREFLA